MNNNRWFRQRLLKKREIVSTFSSFLFKIYFLFWKKNWKMGLGIMSQSSPTTQGLIDQRPPYDAQKYPSAFALKLWFPASGSVRHNGPGRKSIALLWWLTLARGCPESITCSSLQGRKGASLLPSLRLDLLCILEVLLTFPNSCPIFFFFSQCSPEKKCSMFHPILASASRRTQTNTEMSSVCKLCYTWKWGRY